MSRMILVIANMLYLAALFQCAQRHPAGIYHGGKYMKKYYLGLQYLFLASLLFCVAACGPGNIVRLLPPPPLAASTLPAPNAPSVCVVNFTNERIDPETVGVRRDGSAFVTSGDVALWISRALSDELARKGFRVTFAMGTSQARAANPDYLVTGKVEEVWLKESSATEMSAQMRINCTLANRKGKIWSESCTTSQSRGTLPYGGSADNLLLNSLNELITPVAQKITQTIDSKK